MTEVAPPEDWSDREGWDRYLLDRLASKGNHPRGASDSLRFAEFALSRGGNVWFPGCGIDLAPVALASVGCDVCASDISNIAVERQRSLAEISPEDVFGDWAEARGALQPKRGQLSVLHHDFAAEPPPKPFDLVINSRAFHGLRDDRKESAAHNFKASLREGGALIMDTLNVQGTDRDSIEAPLVNAGFYIPFFESEKWYRTQLKATGIIYAMVLGRPVIPHWQQYPEASFAEFKDRDQKILAGFRPEYEKRRQAEEDAVRVALADPTTVVAHVVYSTG